MIPLKPREVQCLNFLKAKIAELGYSPSLREIGRALGFKSPANAHWVIRALEDKKYVKRIPGKHRSLSIIPQGDVIVLNPEINTIVSQYAQQHGILKDVAACELIRFGAGAA